MASTPSIQKWDEIFDQVLAKNGMDKGEIKRRPQGALKIIQEATIAFDLRKTPAMMWQMCSAATHGKKWVTGILTMMDGQDDGESKVISGKLTSDEMLILLATHAACLLIRPLFEVQARHSKPENHSGESFLKPSHRLLVPSRGFLVPDRFNC